jgi:hypothetical protein
MEKERLKISPEKVTVEFDFLNDSDQNITTEVAFPIPPYTNSESAGGVRAFDDFKLWVDGKELKYTVEAKAYLGRWDGKTQRMVDEKDVTELLQKYKIDIPSLGHYLDADNHGERTPDFERLGSEAKKRISDLGLVDAADGVSRPNWEVRKKYHWTQTFPAHGIVHIRHTYSPGVGFTQMQADEFDEAARPRLIAEDKKIGITNTAGDIRNLQDACVDAELQRTIFSDANTLPRPKDGYTYVQATWVDYILTSANSWKMPIKDFKLTIDKGPHEAGARTFVSLCWDGPVRKVDEQHYEASAADFVPKREPHILFLTVTPADLGPATAVSEKDAVSSGGATKFEIAATSSSRRPFWRALWWALLPLVLGTALLLWFRRRRRSAA